MNNSKILKLVIVTPHPLEREMLVLRLSMMPHFAVCGAADNEEDAARLVGEHSVDLAIIDMALQVGTGFDLIQRFRLACPLVKLLVIAACSDSIHAERIIRLGASGYVDKRQPVHALLEAVRNVACGQVVVHGGRAHHNGQVDVFGQSRAIADQLSDRELQVFELIGMGHPSRSIAHQLHLSRHTIDSHRENIKKKLGLKSSAELTRTAVQWQLEQR